jgi:DNA-binding HxlR family transcriptional regulator
VEAAHPVVARARTLRFRELERQLPDTSRKVLVQQLRQLESDGLVRRTVHAEVPPRVEYALTHLGRKVLPVLDALDAWGGEMVAAGLADPAGPPPTRSSNGSGRAGVKVREPT